MARAPPAIAQPCGHHALHFRSLHLRRCSTWPVRRRRHLPTSGAAESLKACDRSSTAIDRLAVSLDGGCVAAVAAFVAQRGGSISEKLAVRIGPGSERALYAREPIRPGELLFSIPRACYLTCRKDDLPCAPQMRSHFEGSHGSNLALAVRLLAEGAHTSSPTGPFAVFYKTLPRHLNTPIMWGVDDLLGLSGHSRALAELYKKKQRLTNAHAVLKDYYDVTPQDLYWAEAIVTSRCFNYEESGSRLPCMMPFGDLVNHHPIAGSYTTYTIGPDQMALTCIREIPSGDEVRITYGPLGNDELLFSYGFTLEVNEEENGYCPDEVSFLLPLPPSACGDEVRKRLLLAAGVDPAAGVVKTNVTYLRNVAELFSVMRLLYADDEDIALLRAARIQPTDAYSVKSISVSNECKMLKVLWMYACTRCTGIDSLEASGPAASALDHIAEAIARSLRDRQAQALDDPMDRGEPRIAAMAREALEHCGAVQYTQLRDAWALKRNLASQCAAHRSVEQGGDRSARAAWRTELTRRAIASERRVFAHFAALAATATAVLGLSGADRERLLPHLEATRPLAGLTLSSRDIISRYVRGFCRRFKGELEQRVLPHSPTVHQVP